MEKEKGKVMAYGRTKRSKKKRGGMKKGDGLKGIGRKRKKKRKKRESEKTREKEKKEKEKEKEKKKEKEKEKEKEEKEKEKEKEEKERERERKGKGKRGKEKRRAKGKGKEKKGWRKGAMEESQKGEGIAGTKSSKITKKPHPLPLPKASSQTTSTIHQSNEGIFHTNSNRTPLKTSNFS